MSLRLLDPATDLELIREAYNWRTDPKKHTQPDRAPFESLLVPERQIIVGLFNGEFQAIYVLYEFEPSRFEAHFTSRRGVPRETLLEGAQETIDAFFQNGAKEIVGWVVVKNRALRGFLEALGFAATETKSFPKNKDSDSCKVQEFVKYVLMEHDHRTFRQKTDFHSDESESVRIPERTEYA